MSEQKEVIRVELSCGVDYYKGEKGDKPIKGVDYFTEQDINEIIERIEAGEIDLTSYATKEYVADAIEDMIVEETDPTVPEWAKQSTKPSYTANEVGALPADTPLFSGNYNDLSNKPTLFSGNYNDLTNKPSLFSGNYNDLSNKPTIPSVPVNISAFYNDAGYLTSHQSLSGYATEQYVDQTIADNINDLNNDIEIPSERVIVGDTDGDAIYLDSKLADIENAIPIVPSNVSAFTNDVGYLTSHQSLTDYATKAYVDDAVEGVVFEETDPTVPAWAKQSNKPSYTAQEVGALPANTPLFSGSYDDLSNKPTIPSVPVNISAFYNDAGYLTTHQSLTDYATKSYVDTAIENIDIPDAGITVETDPTVPQWAKQANKPSYTAQEVGALPANTQLFSGSYNDLTNKPTLFSGDYDDLSNKPTLFSGNYNDLTNKPTIPVVPSNVSAFTNDAGYLTSHQSLTGYATESYVDDAIANIELPDGGITIETDPTVPSWAKQASKPTYTAQEVGALPANTALFSGNYNDLTNKPTLTPAPIVIQVEVAGQPTVDSDGNYRIPLIPTSNNMAEAYAQYQTHPSTVGMAVDLTAMGLDSIMYLDCETFYRVDDGNGGYDYDTYGELNDSSLSGHFGFRFHNINVYATTQGNGYASFGKIVGLATVNELADYATQNWVYNQHFLTSHQDISGKANSADLATVATSGDYNDLTNKPTIPTAYTLPTASTSTLGGVKVDGSSITIDANGVISSSSSGGGSATDADDISYTFTPEGAQQGIEMTVGQALDYGLNAVNNKAGYPINGTGENIIVDYDNSGVEIEITYLSDKLDEIDQALANAGGGSSSPNLLIHSIIQMTTAGNNMPGVVRLTNTSTFEDFIDNLKAGKIIYIATSTSYTFNNDYKITPALLDISTLYAMNLDAFSAVNQHHTSISSYSSTGTQVYYSKYYYFDGHCLWTWEKPENLGNFIAVNYRNTQNTSLVYALKQITNDIDDLETRIPSAPSGINTNNLLFHMITKPHINWDVYNSIMGNDTTWEQFVANLKAGKVIYVNGTTSYTQNINCEINASLLGVSTLYVESLIQTQIPQPFDNMFHNVGSIGGMGVGPNTYYYFDGEILWTWEKPEELNNLIKVHYRNYSNVDLVSAIKDITDDIDELASEKQDAIIPTAPTTDGNYVLKVSVSSGTPTYSWVAE